MPSLQLGVHYGFVPAFWLYRQFEAEVTQLHSDAAAYKQDVHAMSEQLAVYKAYTQQQEQELAKCRVSSMPGSRNVLKILMACIRKSV